MTWKDENSLEIVSEPEVQVSYAKSLKTEARLDVCGNSQGVSIDVKVVVSDLPITLIAVVSGQRCLQRV